MANSIRLLNDQELQKAIKKLNQKYLKYKSEYNSRQILTDCIEEFGGLFAAQTKTNKTPRHFFFFRVHPAHRFNSIEEVCDPKRYTYPSPDKCKNVGRAHLIGFPVFYGSDSYEGAILEMKMPGVDKYYVSIWYTDPIQLTVLNFLFANNISASRLIENFDVTVQDMWSEYSRYSKFSKQRLRSHLMAWSDLFLSESYMLTASIAHQNMYGDYNYHDVISYGSAIDGSFINYAIHPRLADKMTLYKVFSTCFKSPNTPVEFIQCAILNENFTLDWRQVTEADLPENDSFLTTKLELP